MNQQELRALAERLRRITENKLTPLHLLYMTNINHGALNPLYVRFRAANGTPYHSPLSYEERFLFELMLLNSATIKEIVAYCDQHDQRLNLENTKEKDILTTT